MYTQLNGHGMCYGLSRRGTGGQVLWLCGALDCSAFVGAGPATETFLLVLRTALRACVQVLNEELVVEGMGADMKAENAWLVSILC